MTVKIQTLIEPFKTLLKLNEVYEDLIVQNVYYFYFQAFLKSIDEKKQTLSYILHVYNVF